MDIVQDRNLHEVTVQLERDIVALKLLFVLTVVIGFAIALVMSPATDSNPQQVPPATTVPVTVD